MPGCRHSLNAIRVHQEASVHLNHFSHATERICPVDLVRSVHRICLPVGPVEQIAVDCEAKRVNNAIRCTHKLSAPTAGIIRILDAILVIISPVYPLVRVVNSDTVRFSQISADNYSSVFSIHRSTLNFRDLTPISPEH